MEENVSYQELFSERKILFLAKVISFSTHENTYNYLARKLKLRKSTLKSIFYIFEINAWNFEVRTPPSCPLNKWKIYLIILNVNFVNDFTYLEWDAMLRFNQNNGYSQKYKELAVTELQHQRQQINDRTKKLCVENKKRRKWVPSSLK